MTTRKKTIPPVSSHLLSKPIEIVKAICHVDSSLPPRFQWDKDNFEEWFENPAHFLMLSDKNHFPFGYYTYLYWNDSIILKRLVLLPDYRRQGIGSNIIQAMESKHQDLISTSCHEYNLSAQLFFRANGFTYVKTKGSTYYFDKELV